MEKYSTAPLEYDFGGSRTRVLVSGRQTDDAYCLLEMFSPAGRRTPTHSHDREEETVIMLSGELEVTVDGKSHRMHPGGSIVLPRGSVHQLSNVSDDVAHYMIVCTPAGFENFVDACSEAHSTPVVPQPPTDSAKEKMRDAAARFGIKLIPSV